jgi:hypothetical protein
LVVLDLRLIWPFIMLCLLYLISLLGRLQLQPHSYNS